MPRPSDASVDRLGDLVRAHQVGLWRYLRYLGCESQLAEDLVQETFVTAWRQPPQDRGPRQTAAWLRTVARNHYRMALRKARVRPMFFDLDAADAAWTAAASDGGDRLLEALRECLAHLTERARRALGIFYAEDRSRTRVAEALDMTADGVKTMLRRAREKLRDCVGRRVR